MLRALFRLVARFPWLVASTRRVSDSLEVVRCGDFLIALPVSPPEQPSTVEAASDARVEKLAGWVRSGGVTWGEAEALLVLDETTPWESRGH